MKLLSLVLITLIFSSCSQVPLGKIVSETKAHRSNIENSPSQLSLMKPKGASERYQSIYYWQKFIYQANGGSKESNRQTLLQLTQSDSDQLARLILLIQPYESVEIRTQSVNEIIAICDSLPEALQPVFMNFSLQANRQIEQQRILEQKEEEISSKNDELATLKAELAEANEKILALTNIEKTIEATKGDVSDE